MASPRAAQNCPTNFARENSNEGSEITAEPFYAAVTAVMPILKRILLVTTLLLGCVGCDQATKVAARAYLSDGPTISFLHDTVRLTYAENPGAFLSLGASLSEPTRAIIFQGVISLLIAGLVLSAALWPRLGRSQVIALALLGASGLGNLVDRLLYEGRVTDFLNVGIGGLRTGVFNVADILGFTAVILLVVFRNAAVPPDSRAPRPTGPRRP